MIINGYKVTQKEFAHEGCHKFYLIADVNERYQAELSDYQVYDIEELEDYWNSACELRFISTWDLKEQIVKQTEHAVFVYDD